MLRNSLFILVIVSLLATPAAAFVTGDPIDGNDGPSYLTVEEDCAYAEANPYCSWCWTKCVFALMMEVLGRNGEIDWDW